MPTLFVYNIPPWPEYLTSSNRFFKDMEKHVTRICKEFVLIFMLESFLYFTENGQDICLGPGEWYIQIPGLKQEGIKPSPAPVYYYIHFSASGYVDGQQGDMPGNYPNIMEKNTRIALPVRGRFDLRFLKPLFDQLDSLSQRYPQEELGKQSIFLNILNYLVKSESRRIVVREPVIQMMRYLAENYNKPLMCSKLSDRFHFTPDYLARKMKQSTGMTPWQYVQQIRVDKAKELLTNTDYTMEIIARSVGYSDLSLFYKAFTKHTGMAPGKWRNEERKIF